MIKEIKKLWIEDLRSNPPQATGELKNEDGYCCLGRLCELIKDKPEYGGKYIDMKEDEIETRDNIIRTKAMYSSSTGLSIPIMKRLKLSTSEVAELMNMNDGEEDYEGNPQNFSQIADWIEENL